MATTVTSGLCSLVHLAVDYVAQTLNNLAILYSITGRRADAKTAIIEGRRQNM